MPAKNKNNLKQNNKVYHFRNKHHCHRVARILVTCMEGFTIETNLFSYIGLGFGILLLLNIAYLLLWVIFSKWKLAFISLIALLVCYKPILTFSTSSFPEEAPPNSIKILTYNVEGFRNEAHKNAFTHPVLEYIADTDADIVCLQEYMISKTGQSLISQHDVNKILHKYPYRSVTGLESSGKYHIYGLACFSKFLLQRPTKSSSINRITDRGLYCQYRQFTLYGG